MKSGLLALALVGVIILVRFASPAKAAPAIQPATRAVPPGSQWAIDETKRQWIANPPDPLLPDRQRGKLLWVGPDYGPVDPSRMAH